MSKLMMKATRGLAVLALCWASAIQAQEPDDASALAELLQPLESMRAEFHQTVRDERGEVLQEGSGWMEVMRPHRLRWQTEEPYRYLVVTDGTLLWRYDADLEQVNREPFQGELADAPGLILSGEPRRIAKHYHVRRSGDTFTLEPRREDGLFQRLSLEWEGNVPRRMMLLDRLDQSTEIVFSEVQRNPGFSAERFRFEPPAGVDVIRHD